MKTINNDTLRLMMSKMRQDIRKGFCSLCDACDILDVSQRKFYLLLREKDTQIRASKIQGKYLLDSIYKEVERLTL